MLRTQKPKRTERNKNKKTFFYVRVYLHFGGAAICKHFEKADKLTFNYMQITAAGATADTPATGEICITPCYRV